MKKETIVENVVSKINRRDFLRGAAISTLGIASMGVLAACGTQTSSETAAPAAGAVTNSIVKIELPEFDGADELSLAEINAMRKQIVEAQEEYVCADGTVIPAVYVKLRALIDTIGSGVGSAVTDASFGEIMYLFSEEEAQACLEMPCGVYFTATDFSVESGRDEAECLALCEELATRGVLFRARRAGVPYFHMIAEAHGIWEYNLLRLQEPDYVVAHAMQWGSDIIDDLYNADTIFYYPIPVNKDVVADEQIYPYDDYEKIIRRNSVIAVSPCQCRLSHKLIGTESPDCIHPLETCISTGEEAEFYIENGIGRQIDQDEALEILHNNVELGMVIQSCYTKDTEVICSCHGDCCDILMSYVALGENAAGLSGFQNLSHYNLQYDKDACIKCGACQDRCPLFAITMDEEGYPVVGPTCIKCGQCGTVCPVGARKLSLKDSIPELPQCMLDDYNLKSEYRFRNNQI
ncbi:MAG: 4Fe-4S dicluster domain-containing protein [Bacteroidia bacterium]|nr:4Fe-4S dicluster domain-containing protein [Bacteroidia bacterium]